MKKRYLYPLAVFGVLFRGNQVLLLKRSGTGYEDGNYTLPSGHVDEGESIKMALVREMNEELGIECSQDDTAMSLFMHRKADDGERVDVFFEVKKWSGEPKNNEPNKCAGVDWFEMNNLPANTIEFVREALSKIEKKDNFSDWGW